ncbi:hypothetical protein [Streptomyces sp. NPDC047097]|uniref:hypothetical protein n=1 Tax=Streptomyces sp. NPDC047097 TaxID=3155260 RepID=UPI0033E1E1D2
MSAPVEQSPKRPPDWPPRTPPPPKRPVELPRPEPKNPKTETAGARAVMRNRRGANWPYESQPWIASRAAERVLDRLTAWRYQLTDTRTQLVQQVVRTLVGAAVGDGGQRISVHLADQQGHVCIAALSHQPSAAPALDALLGLARLRVADCGAEDTADGRQHWAVIDLT